MREKNRNSIASCIKLPQFTTMNVIDGQAGFIIYSSLIFYSLTIDNILNIIVLLILAGITVAALTGSNGVIDRTVNAKNMTNKGAILEKIKLECLALTNSDEIKNKDSKEIFEIIKENLDLNDANFKIYSKCMHITTKEGWNYTVGFDLSIYEELVAYLDIADGTIDLKQEGYVQNNKSLVKYGGKYIITGTSKEHVVRVMEEGRYNIVLKDLNIDVS